MENKRDFATNVAYWGALSGNNKEFPTVTGEMINVLKQLGELSGYISKLLGLIK